MRQLIAWMWPMFCQRWRVLLPACALALLTAAAAIGLLGVAGWFLTATALVTAALATFNLFVPSAMVRGLAFTRILSRYFERVSGHAATLQLLADLRTRVFDNLLRLDAGQLASWRDGDLVARLTGDVDALDTTFLLSLLPLLVGIVAGVGVVAVLAIYVPMGAIAVGLLWLCTLLLMPVWLARRVRASGIERQAHAAALRQQVLQAVEGHADLLALGAEGNAAATLNVSSECLRTAALTESRASATGQAMALACSGLAMLAVATAGVQALAEGRVSAAVLVGCVLAVAALFETMAPVLRGASRLGTAIAAAARVQELEQARPKVTDPTTPVPLSATGTLALQAVGFRYHPEVSLLEGVDLQLAPGQRVAITGTSGSGKSTLLALVLRLRDPQSGVVSWNDVDLRRVELAALHRRIALLPQEPPIFLGTVRDNLLIGDSDADDTRLWRVLAEVDLDAEVRALPGGLNQWLGEGGRTLSAGQARRLCLARVLLGDAALVVLDEPTEGLDAEAEQAFFRDLPRILRGRTLLLSTHAAMPPGTVHAAFELVAGKLVPKPVGAYVREALADLETSAFTPSLQLGDPEQFEHLGFVDG